MAQYLPLGVKAGPAPGKGRGVFATRDFEKDELIERVPILLLPSQQEYDEIKDTVLDNYVYDWPGGGTAIALGLGSIYNHSYHENARHKKNVEGNCIEFYAVKPIQCGQEITINYMGSSSQDPVWFDVVDDSKEKGDGGKQPGP